MDSVVLDDSQPYCDTYWAIFDGQICMTVLYSNVTDIIHKALGTSDASSPVVIPYLTTINIYLVVIT
jgi:hypothetical protein